MLALLTALTVATAPPPCCERPAAFDVVAAAAVPNETAHRIGHFISPAIGTASAYGFALHFGAGRSQARWIAVGLSVAAIIAKELYDERVESGAYSAGDIAVGLAGTASGIVLAEFVLWPAR